MSRLALAAALAVHAACSGSSGSDEHHDHGDEEELPARSVTTWAEHSELFMEYQPLVVGKESRFAAHVTLLPSFKAATSGTVTVALEGGGKKAEGRADKPSSPGIFRAVLTPAAAGACKLTVTIERDGARDVIQPEECAIYPDEAAAQKALGGESEPPGRITYLKEQAWVTDFANQPVAERELQPSVRATGEIKPVAGKEARLTAPGTGRILFADVVPVLGMAVAKGQILASLTPRLDSAGDRAGLEAESGAARAELEAAEAQLARAERLFADKAIAEKQVEEARTRVAVARARLGGASGRLQRYHAAAGGAGGIGRDALRVRAPIAGTLVEVSATAGQTVEEGQPLFSIIDLSRIWLEARVFEADIPKVEKARSAWFTIEGHDKPFSVEEANGKLVTVGRVIDPASRTVQVVFELDNPQGALRIGQYAVVWIATGEPVRALAIPESAIVEEGGKPVVYVQVEGESFERRPLTLGIRSAGWVGVLSGLKAGERVVTRGAYEIRLTSAAGSVPAHGHVH